MLKREGEAIQVLTRELDAETEALLRDRGQDWFFKARRKLYRAMKEE